MAFTDIFESPRLIHPVDEYDPSRTLVVGLCDVLEPLLPSRIPDLQLDALIPHAEGLDLEVDSNGGHVVHAEDILAEAKEDVRLPHSTVSNYYNFEHFLLCSFFTHLLYSSSSKSTTIESPTPTTSNRI